MVSSVVVGSSLASLSALSRQDVGAPDACGIDSEHLSFTHDCLLVRLLGERFMAHCWLYIYENRERRQIYIGIADQMDRVFEDHNSDAMELLSADGTEIIQTVLPFSSRADARKAEAIAIHIAVFAGQDVAVTTEDGRSMTYTNRAGVQSTRELGPAIFLREGVVDAASMSGTIFVPITPSPLDGRVGPFGGSKGAVFADRASRYWNVALWKRSHITRVVAVLTGPRKVILGDWDVRSAESWRQPDPASSRVEIPLVDESDDDPRGVKGMTLSGHRLNSGVTYSQDLR